MGNYTQPNPFEPGFRLIGGEKLNNAIAADLVSTQDGITAHSGGGSTSAFQLTAVINRVTTVAATNDSVKLPAAQAGATVTIDNDSTNILAVYPKGSDLIEDSASSVALAVGQDTTFVCPVIGKWYQLGSSGTFGAITATDNITELTVGKGFIQKASSLGTARAGTFTVVGVANVTVTNSTVATSDFIGISLNTPTGTVGAMPTIQTIQPGVSFVVKATAADSSTYNYSMIGVN